MTEQPTLRFSPAAWAKLLFLRDAGDTEIATFGLTYPDDPLYVYDVWMVKQEATGVTVEFDDDAVAAFMEKADSVGIEPVNCTRIWIHTHPGDSPTPSGTDESTFAKRFGIMDWSVMFILAKGGRTYTRLRHQIFGMEFQTELRAMIDFSSEFDGVTENQRAGWQKVYDACVEKKYGLQQSWGTRSGAYQSSHTGGYSPVKHIDKKEAEVVSAATQKAQKKEPASKATVTRVKESDITVIDTETGEEIALADYPGDATPPETMDGWDQVDTLDSFLNNLDLPDDDNPMSFCYALISSISGTLYVWDNDATCWAYNRQIGSWVLMPPNHSGTQYVFDQARKNYVLAARNPESLDAGFESLWDSDRPVTTPN